MSEALDSLTPREREVLQFVAEGLTSAAIAKRLVISVNTVQTMSAMSRRSSACRAGTRQRNITEPSHAGKITDRGI